MAQKIGRKSCVSINSPSCLRKKEPPHTVLKECIRIKQYSQSASNTDEKNNDVCYIQCAKIDFRSILS